MLTGHSLAGRYLICLCLLIALASTAYGQQSVALLLTQGDAAYDAFDNHTAIDFYEKALLKDSTDFETLIRMGRTNYDLGLDLIAEDNLKEAFHRFEDAIINSRALVTHYPDSAQSHFLLAATSGNLALFKNGREKVILGRIVELHSKKAIELDTTLSYPYVSLGIYYRELSRLSWLERTLAKVFFGRLPEASVERALELLDTAQRLRFNFPFLHFELAMTFMSLNQNEKALHHLETLVSLKPETTQDARNQEYAKKLIAELKGL